MADPFEKLKRSLIGKLNRTCSRALEQAIGLCNTRSHSYVELDHWLLALLEADAGDLAFVLRQYAIDAGKVKRELETALNRLRTGARGTPGLATEILDAVQVAWVFASLEQGAHKVRSAYLLYAVLSDPKLRGGVVAGSPELGRVSVEKLRADLADLLPASRARRTTRKPRPRRSRRPVPAKPRAAPDPAGRRPHSTSSP